MLYIKKICIVIFCIITILFTIGYFTQPIIDTSQITQEPTNADGTVLSNKISSSFYIGKISDIKNLYNNNDYSNLNNDIIIDNAVKISNLGMSILQDQTFVTSITLMLERIINMRTKKTIYFRTV